MVASNMPRFAQKFRKRTSNAHFLVGDEEVVVSSMTVEHPASSSFQMKTDKQMRFRDSWRHIDFDVKNPPKDPHPPFRDA